MADPSPGSERRTVLLIDEDPAVARQVRAALVAPRFSTAVASRALDGLRLAARQKPHLILMEARFANGSGVEMARRLMVAPETRNCAVIIYSQERSLALRLHVLHLGAAGFIGKPIDASGLVQRIEGIMGQLMMYGLPSDVSKLPGAHQLLTLIKRAEEEQISGSIEVAAGGQRGVVALERGRATRIELGQLQGDEALEALARRGDWQVRFVAPAASGPSGRPSAPTAAPPGGTGPTAAPPGPSLAPQAALLGGADDDPPDEEATVIESGEGGLLGSGPMGRPPARRVDPQETIEVPVGQFRGETPAWESAQPQAAFALAEFDDDDDDLATQAGAMPLLGDGALDNFRGSGEASPANRPAPTFSPPVGRAPAVSPPAAASASARPYAAPPLADEDEDMLGSFEEDEPTRQAPAYFRPIVEDESQREVVVPLSQLQQASPTPAPLPTNAADARGELLAALGAPPLLLVMPDATARGVFEAAIKQQGFNVLSARGAAEALALVLQRRPVAVICEAELPDADGRELLAGVRCDFRVRETPFIIVGTKAMAPALQQTGVGAVAPVLGGVMTALGPRVELFARVKLMAGEVGGRVEPVGLVNLLRTLGAARVSGRLHLRVGETRNAEVTFGRGEVCGVTVNAPQISVGPLAMLHLVGYEWQEYVFHPEPGDSPRVPLGDLVPLVETAMQQNNTFLARVYAEGTKLEDVQVERGALDAYLQTQSPQSYELLIQLVEGAAGGALAEAGAAPAAALKSVLFELRRRAVLRPLSLRPTRAEQALSWGVFEPLIGEDPISEESWAPALTTGRRRRRWPVVLAACLITVLLALGGFFVYRYVKVGHLGLGRAPKAGSERSTPAPPASAPTSAPSKKAQSDPAPVKSERKKDKTVEEKGEGGSTPTAAKTP